MTLANVPLRCKFDGEHLRLIVQFEIPRPAGGTRTFKALIDSGAQINVIDQMIVRALSLKLSDKERPETSTVNDQEFPLHSVVEIPVTVSDSAGEARTKEQVLYGADLSGFDAILGYPWLQELDPDVRWRDGTFEWRPQLSTDSKVQMVSADAFVYHLKQEGYQNGYAMLPLGALPEHPQGRLKGHRRLRANALKASGRSQEEHLEFAPIPLEKCYEAHKGESSSISAYDVPGHCAYLPGSLPKRYKDFEDVFAEKFDILEHSEHDHPIDLVDGGKAPHMPIYNLSEKELGILRDYLRDAQAKG